MQRISNRAHSDASHVTTQVQYVDRIKEVTVEKIIEIPVLSEPQIIEKVVEKQLPAPVVDLQPLHDQYNHLAQVLVESHNRQANQIDEARVMLDMQGRALIEMKRQRNLDRIRRLQLIKKMKKHQNKQKKVKLKMNLVLGFSLVLTIISLLIK